MSAIVVPERPDSHGIRWNVVRWRLVGTVAVLVFALTVSVVPVSIHWWNTEIARLECPSASELGFPGDEVRVGRGWGEPGWCTVVGPRGELVSSGVEATVGRWSVVEPRGSLLVAVGVLAAIWGLAGTAIWAIWRTGRAHPLPRDAGRVLVA